MLSLADPPAVRVYTASQAEELVDDVARIEAGTSMRLIDTSRCLEMDNVGTLENGFRFTTSAFRQLCRILAGGMSNLLDDIVGKRRRKTATENEFSASTAISIFNRLLRLRLQRVVGRVAVCNTADKTIDGFVSQKYKYLSNSVFVRGVFDGLAGDQMKFHRGYLYGRQLALRFVRDNKISVVTPNGVTIFAAGRHYANSEIGDAAVCTAPIVTLADGSAALGSYDVRLPHAGSDFSGKLRELINYKAHGPDEKLITSWIEAVRSQSLISDQNKYSAEGLSRSKSSLERKLASRGLTQKMARQLSAISLFGADFAGFPNIEDFANKSLAISQRTSYDVCIALMRTSARMPLNSRLRIEHLAYDLLCGKFSL